MIEKFRKSVNTIVAKVLLGLLAIAFVFLWGGQDGLRMIGVGQSNTVAKVGAEKVTMQELGQKLSQTIALIQFETGQQISPDQVRKMGLDRQVLEALIQQKLVDVEVENLGIGVSDGYVAREIKSQDIFKDQKGAFSKDTFLARIRQLGYRNERDYVDARKAEIARQWLISALSGGATAPAVATDPLYRWEQQTRTGSGVVINYRDMKVKDPSEDELRNFFGENRGRFKISEARDFKALILNTKAYEADAKSAVKDQDVDAIYDVEKDRRFKGVPESEARKAIRTDLEASYVHDKAIAQGQAIDDAFAQGQNLEDIAKQYGTLVSISGARLLKPGIKVEKVSSDLPQSQVESLVDLAFQSEADMLSTAMLFEGGNMALIYVDHIHDPRFPTFQEAESDVKQAYDTEQKINAAKDLVGTLSKEVRAGQSLVSLAHEKGLSVIQIKAKRDESLAPTPYKMNAAALEQFFAVTPGGLALIPVQSKKGDDFQILAVMESIQLGALPSHKDQVKFEKLITDQVRSDILETYLAYLRTKYTIEINDRIFKASS